MPDEACKLWDPSSMPFTTLISKFHIVKYNFIFYFTGSMNFGKSKLIAINN